MNTKHTPGPWVVKHYDENGYLRVSSPNWQSASANNSMVKIEPRRDYDEVKGLHVSESGLQESQANARLIAASPDLLTALQECFLLLQQLAADGEPGDMPSPTLEKARAAIAHATGYWQV